MDVCLGTKIRILKQITTQCLLVVHARRDVCLGTKIRILKQITTRNGGLFDGCLMFVLAQR